MPTGSQNGVETDPNTCPKSKQKVALKREMEIIKRLVFMKGRKLVFGARNTILLFRSGPRSGGLARNISFVEGVCDFLRVLCALGSPLTQTVCQNGVKSDQKCAKVEPKSRKGCQGGSQNGTRIIKRNPCGKLSILGAKMSSASGTFGDQFL